MIETFKEVRIFFSATLKHADKRLLPYIYTSIFFGCGMFLVEVLFVNSLSVLVSHLGINLSATNRLQFLTRFNFEQMILVVVGVAAARSVFQMLVQWLPSSIRHLYIQSFRKSLIPFVLYNPTKKKHSYLFAIYHDHLDRSAGIYQMIPQMASNLAAITLYSFYLFRLSTFFFVGGVVVFFILMFPLKTMGKMFIRYSERLGVASDEQFALIHTGLKNYFFLSLYSKIETECNRARKIMDHVLRTFQRYFLFAGIRTSLPGFIGVGVICFLIYWNSKIEHPTPATILVTFFYLFMKMANMIGDLMSTLNTIPLSIDSARRIMEVAGEMNRHQQDLHPSASKDSAPLSLDQITLKLSNATFSYLGTAESSVGPMNLEVKVGQCIALKGPSGVGKSTVLGMLTGVYPPQSGEATINGIPLSRVKQQFSKVIAYVGPEPYLIPGTLRENLLYCNEGFEISDQQLWLGLETVGLAEFFKSKEYGLEEKLTDIAELSTGQRQRIALCRAFLRNAPILILDEATANLDRHTEDLIIRHLKSIKARSILLISTHKNSFDDISDLIIEMKEK